MYKTISIYILCCTGYLLYIIKPKWEIYGKFYCMFLKIWRNLWSSYSHIYVSRIRNIYKSLPILRLCHHKHQKNQPCLIPILEYGQILLRAIGLHKRGLTEIERNPFPVYVWIYEPFHVVEKRPLLGQSLNIVQTKILFMFQKKCDICVLNIEYIVPYINTSDK